MSDLFCRHNRFTADCPICSKGTVLERQAGGGTRSRAATPAKRSAKRAAETPGGAQFRGPYASAGPYEREDGAADVRLEKVPGGVRLAEWSAGALRPRAPVLPAADLRALVAQARERGFLPERDVARLEEALGAEPSAAGPAEPGAGPAAPAGPGSGPAEPGSAPAAAQPRAFGVSRGRTADLQEELRVEALADGRVRVARWILRPGAGWELQDAPPMLPAARFAEALAAAVRAGAV